MREICGRKREWREPVFSPLGVCVPLPSSECLRVSVLLLMRKKFLMRCETWPSLPLTGLLVDNGFPEKVRFSVMVVLVDGCEELKSCVIAGGRGMWCCCNQEVQRHRPVVEGSYGCRGRRMCREWVSGPWPTWVMSISGFAGRMWLERSVVAVGSKECRSRGGVYEGGRNAGEMGVQRLNLSFTDRRRVRVE